MIPARDERTATLRRRLAEADLEDVPTRLATEPSLQDVDLSLVHFLEVGLLIDVDTQGAGMLTETLDWEDLGVTLPEGEVSFGAPRMSLLPDTYRLPLVRPGQRLHERLAALSLTPPALHSALGARGFRWVPWTAWDDFKAAFSAAQQELATAKGAVAAHEPEIRAIMAQTFGELAVGAIKRVDATGARGRVQVQGGIEGFVARCMTRVPTAALIEERLRVGFSVGNVRLGSEAAAEARAEAEQRLALKAARTAERIEDLKVATAASVLTAQAAEERQTAHLRAEATRADLTREMRVRAEMERVRVRAYQQQVEAEAEVAKQAIWDAERRIHDAAAGVLKTLEKTGKLAGSAGETCRELVATFRRLNWSNNEELERSLVLLAAMAEPASTRKAMKGRPPRDIAALKDVIAGICTATEEAALAIRESERAGRMLLLEI